MWSIELQRFVNGEPILARPVSGPARAWRWCRRKPVLASMTAALVLVFLGGFAGVMSQWIRAEGETSRAEGERTRAEKHAAEEAEARAKADEARKEADREAERANLATAAERAARGQLQHQLYAAHMNLAQQAYEFQNRPVMLELLNRHRPVPDQEDLRGFEWYYLWRLCHRYETNLGRRSTFAPNKHAGVHHLSWADVTGQIIFDIDDLDDAQYVWFSPDGKTIAARYPAVYTMSSNKANVLRKNNELKLWDVDSGKLKALCEGHTEYVHCAAFSPDGKILASGSEDQTVKIWDVATGDLKLTLEPVKNLNFVLFSPNGKTLASGDWYQVTLWDVETGQATASISHSDLGAMIFGLAFSPDSSLLATGGGRSGGSQGEVKLWEIATGDLHTKLVGVTGWVRSLMFAPDGTTLAVAAAETDRGITLWDISTGDIKRTMQGDASFVVFSPDGRALATASNRTVRIWSSDSGDLLAACLGHASLVETVVFSPDGNQLASLGGDSIKVWDMTVAEPKLDVLTPRTAGGHIAFSPDGETLATGTGNQIHLWNVHTGDIVSTFNPKEYSRSYLYSLAFSPDGKTLASGSQQGGGIRVWDVATGNVRHTINNDAPLICHDAPVAFSPDGRTLASTAQGVIKLWDVATGEVRPTRFLANREMVPESEVLEAKSMPRLTPDEARLAVYPPRLGEARCLAFSPEGNTLAGAITGVRVSPRSIRSVRRIVLWDVDTGEPRAVFPEGSAFNSVAFSPDGKLLAADTQTSIQIWRVDTVKVVATLTGHAGSVTSLTFSPDGNTLASAGVDGTIRLWDLATAEPKGTLVARSHIRSIAFSPNGKILASASDDEVKLWRAATDEEVQADNEER